MLAMFIPRWTMLPGLPAPFIGVGLLVTLAALTLAFPELRRGQVVRAVLVAAILAVMLSAQTWAIEILNPCGRVDWFLYPTCWFGDGGRGGGR
jgi:hypothetical protein